MLQTRPSSAGGMLPMPQTQAGQQYGTSQRSSYYGTPNSTPNTTAAYRPAQAPIQPYAFTATPSLNPSSPRQQQQSGGGRVASAPPTLPRIQSHDPLTLANPARQSPNASTSNLSSSSTSSGDRYTFGSRDDSSLPSQGGRRLSNSVQPQPTFAQVVSARASPERYRRAVPRSAGSPTGTMPGPQQKLSSAPSGSGVASVGHLYTPSHSMDNADYARLAAARSHAQQQQQSVSRRNSAHVMTSADDMQLYRQSEDAKRVRRRSMPSMEYLNNMMPHSPFKKPEESTSRGFDKDKQKAVAIANGRAASAQSKHRKASSSESVSTVSNGSRSSSATRNASATAAPTASPASSAKSTAETKPTDQKKDFPPSVHIPPRGSSDAANRVATSAESRPVAMDAAAAGEKKAGQGGLSGSASSASVAADADAASKQRTVQDAPSHLESPAMRHLTAINQKGGRLRSKTSRLRRAFSFGSAADFRAAANDEGAGGKKMQKGAGNDDELYDAEQARIAQQQEEAGIGSSIYAGAKIFAGSTDNLSISSTASSASIMIRKMGRGMKKSTRSLVGLFRPKSIAGEPISESGPGEARAVTPSGAAIEATVSRVTAEAERDRVNVHADVHAQNGGDNSASRKSILGGDSERAEALATIRKGILKNTSGSRSPPPGEDRGLVELQCPPTIGDSPASSAPSTPNDDPLGHKRSGSVAIGGEDYFVSALRLRQDSKSGSSTPQGSMRRNATFSPRIIFYDTWPSQEYDRRGEIATCNRLTPMLAQQIKEELNSFKMEMEVHENSKIYTHFF